MAYDAMLAERVREALLSRSSVEERKMMGGVCFIVAGNMVCGVAGSELMIRTGRDAGTVVLAKPGVRAMKIAGRPTAGFVLVDQDQLQSKRELAEWIERGLAYVATLPPK